MVRKDKVKGDKETYLISSDDFYDDCPVCQLLKRAEEERREPTIEEIEEAMMKKD